MCTMKYPIKVCRPLLTLDVCESYTRIDTRREYEAALEGAGCPYVMSDAAALLLKGKETNDGKGQDYDKGMMSI